VDEVWIWAVLEVVVAPWESETRTAPASDTMYILISSTPVRFRSTRHTAHVRSPPPSEELLSVQSLSSAMMLPCRASFSAAAGMFLITPYA
jgi:hypothetical protein